MKNNLQKVFKKFSLKFFFGFFCLLGNADSRKIDLLKSFEFFIKVFTLTKWLSFIFRIRKFLLVAFFNCHFLSCQQFRKINSCKKFKSYQFAQTNVQNMSSFFVSWELAPAKTSFLLVSLRFLLDLLHTLL